MSVSGTEAAETPTESVVLTDTVKEPATIGVPVILTPSKLKPVGNPRTVVVYGLTPHAIVIGAEYIVPVTPLGRVVVFIATRGLTVS